MGAGGRASSGTSPSPLQPPHPHGFRGVSGPTAGPPPPGKLWAGKEMESLSLACHRPQTGPGLPTPTRHYPRCPQPSKRPSLCPREWTSEPHGSLGMGPGRGMPHSIPDPQNQMGLAASGLSCRALWVFRKWGLAVTYTNPITHPQISSEYWRLQVHISAPPQGWVVPCGH